MDPSASSNLGAHEFVSSTNLSVLWVLVVVLCADMDALAQPVLNVVAHFVAGVIPIAGFVIVRPDGQERRVPYASPPGVSSIAPVMANAPKMVVSATLGGAAQTALDVRVQKIVLPMAAVRTTAVVIAIRVGTETLVTLALVRMIATVMACAFQTAYAHVTMVSVESIALCIVARRIVAKRVAEAFA